MTLKGKWTKANFEIHCRENPEIYVLFVKYALIATLCRKYYSAKSIFHRIRWQTMVEEKESQFKIDDGWISHYARKFMQDYPEHEGFFSVRQRANSYHDDEAEIAERSKVS